MAKTTQDDVKKISEELSAFAEKKFKGADEAVGLVKALAKLANMHMALAAQVVKLESRVAELEKRQSAK